MVLVAVWYIFLFCFLNFFNGFLGSELSLFMNLFVFINRIYLFTAIVSNLIYCKSTIYFII